MLSIMDRITRKINIETEHLKSTIDQVYLKDIYKILHTKAAKIQFSLVHMEHAP